MQLANRTVLVTGASSGIGRELARALAGRECSVVLTGRDRECLYAVAMEVGGVTVEADLSCSRGVTLLADEIRRAHPQVSLIVNNAAVQFNYLLAELTPGQALADIACEVQTNLAAPMQLTALLLPLLQQEALRTGCPSAIVNVTSGLALAPKKTAAVYCATKAGLRTFTKALRFQAQTDWRDGGPDARAIEAMLPLVETPMTAGRGRGKITAAQAARQIFQCG